MQKAIEELKKVISQLKDKRNNIDLTINVIEDSIEALYSAEDTCPKCNGKKYLTLYTYISAFAASSSNCGCDRCNATGKYIELKVT